MHDVQKETDILKDYEELFTGLGCLPGENHIQVDHTVTPVVHAQKLREIARQTEPVERSVSTVWSPWSLPRKCISAWIQMT